MKPCIANPALALLLALSTAAAASESLVFNGSGIRTRMILGTLYELSLFVPESQKGSAAKAILEADLPMELVLEIKSGLITRVRFVEATTAGFAKAAEAGYASEKTQTFLDQFANTEFKKGDVIVMRYGSDGLSTLYRKTDGSETKLSTIPGLDLKKALFAIWLGDSPVQASLKQGLLGAK
jgi:hypothetical protein